MHMGVVLKVLVKEGPLGIHFLKRDPNLMGNLQYGHSGDRYFEQLPYVYSKNDIVVNLQGGINVQRKTQASFSLSPMHP